MTSKGNQKPQENPQTTGDGSHADRQSVRTTGSTEALPMAPALGASLEQAKMPLTSALVDLRILFISALAIVAGVIAAVVSDLLMLAINVITDICFYGGRTGVFAPVRQVGLHSSTFVLQPTTTVIGAWVIVMPVVGGLIAGVLARFGSRQIQGHGIPEAIEQILEHESNIAPRIAWLKPVSSAFAIGTGGPFGAEGPIISTGGAVGSLIGQLLSVTADERKTLLAAGAAAGMAAVFGAPVASVVMAIELLLFEFRPRSLIPVALATVVATGIRYLTHGPGAVFAMPNVTEPGGLGMLIFVLLGLVVGYASVWVTRSVYFIEDLFGKTRINWVWWPAIGAVVAGVIGYFEPATLGVGYGNIDKLMQGGLAFGGLGALLLFGILKFVSWSVSLGSGTSGGTLAPLFMIGGSLGAAITAGLDQSFPSLQLNVDIGALVGMGAMFAGSARALLTAVIFCFETTRQPAGFLPLLGGCAAAYLISSLTMKNTIMTEKIERRGIRVPGEYIADTLERFRVRDLYTRDPYALKLSDRVATVRRWFSQHTEAARYQAYPVVDDEGRVHGVINRQDIMDSTFPDTTCVGELLKRGPHVVFEDNTLREAADLMVAENVGRLIVVERAHPTHMVGILTRADVLAANGRRIHEMRDRRREIELQRALRRHLRFGRRNVHFGRHSASAETHQPSCRRDP